MVGEMMRRSTGTVQTAHALDFSRIEHAQQLDLHVERHIPDFVEEQRARVRKLELAGPPALP